MAQRGYSVVVRAVTRAGAVAVMLAVGVAMVEAEPNESST